VFFLIYVGSSQSQPATILLLLVFPHWLVFIYWLELPLPLSTAADFSPLLTGLAFGYCLLPLALGIAALLFTIRRVQTP
jgi:hypothetical protein